MSKQMSDSLLVRYVLGDVSEEEQLRVEAEYFPNREAFELLVAIEDELTYEYLAGRLTRQQRLRFERRFPERVKAQFPRALTAAVGGRRKKYSWIHWMPVSLAAAFALLIIYVGIDERNRGRQTVAVARAPATVMRVELSPGLLRSEEEIAQILIPTAADEIRFDLNLRTTAGYTVYRASIKKADGGEIWSQKVTERAVQAPCKLFSPGQYEIDLQGENGRGSFEDAADYHFRVIR